MARSRLERSSKMTTEERKAEDARFRQEYPLFAQYPELIYLDNAATTQKPSCVIQAESAFYEKYNANPFRGVYELAEFATEHYEEARAAVAELLHANTDEIGDAQVAEIKAAQEKMMESAQKLFAKMYEQTQQAGGQAGPDMNMGGGAAGSTDAGNNDDVVDADYKEV